MTAASSQPCRPSVSRSSWRADVSSSTVTLQVLMSCTRAPVACSSAALVWSCLMTRYSHWWASAVVVRARMARRRARRCMCAPKPRRGCAGAWPGARWGLADVFGCADAGADREAGDAVFADLEVAHVEHAPVVGLGGGVPGAPLLHRASGDDIEGLAVWHLAHPDDGTVELPDAGLVPDDRVLGVEEALDLEELEAARAVLVDAAGEAHHGALEAVLHERGLRLVDLFLGGHGDGRDRLDGVAGGELGGEGVEGFEALVVGLLEVVAVDDVVDVEDELLGEPFAVLLDEPGGLLEGFAVGVDLAVVERVARQEVGEGACDVLDRADVAPALAASRHDLDLVAVPDRARPHPVELGLDVGGVGDVPGFALLEVAREHGPHELGLGVLDRLGVLAVALVLPHRLRLEHGLFFGGGGVGAADVLGGGGLAGGLLRAVGEAVCGEDVGACGPDAPGVEAAGLAAVVEGRVRLGVVAGDGQAGVSTVTGSTSG